MVWCISALLLFLVELISGTFYLLVISAAMLSSGLSEWLFNTSTITNMIIATAFSVIGIVIVRLWQRKHPRQNLSNPADDTDYGQTVILIDQLNENLWQVRYRGTIWQGTFADPITLKSGDTALITGHNGNILNLTSAANFEKGNNL